jgi:hypothetical protein
VEFLRNAPEGTYDAIIVDSSDPIGELMLPWIVFLEHSTMERLCYVFVVYISSVHFGFLLSIILLLKFINKTTRGRKRVTKPSKAFNLDPTMSPIFLFVPSHITLHLFSPCPIAE